MTDRDIFKTVPLRLVGLSLGFAEAAKYGFVKTIVYILYTIGILFAIVHVVHTAVTKRSLPKILQNLCFEVMCTLIIPPAVTNFLCDIVEEHVGQIHQLPTFVKRWAPFMFGVLMLPLLRYYMDPLADDFIKSFTFKKK